MCKICGSTNCFYPGLLPHSILYIVRHTINGLFPLTSKKYTYYGKEYFGFYSEFNSKPESFRVNSIQKEINKGVQ